MTFAYPVVDDDLKAALGIVSEMQDQREAHARRHRKRRDLHLVAYARPRQNSLPIDSDLIPEVISG